MNKDFVQSKFIREIEFFNPAVTIDINLLMEGDRIAGQPMVTSLYAQSFLRTDGMQLRVQKELSDDLIDSDFHNLDMAAVAWPAKAIEFHFEDPTLPSIILCHTSGTEIKERFGSQIVMTDYGERLLAVMQTNDGRYIVQNVWHSMWKEVLVGGKRLHMPGGLPLDEKEDAALLDMIRLAMKVLAYCSLPRFALRPADPATVTRRTGGKLGFKGRPRMPQKRAVYMPALHTPRPLSTAASGQQRTFRGRRGYFRFFHHDRYINMKNKWIYVGPVRVAGSTPLVGVARKVGAA